MSNILALMLVVLGTGVSVDQPPPGSKNKQLDTTRIVSSRRTDLIKSIKQKEATAPKEEGVTFKKALWSSMTVSSTRDGVVLVFDVKGKESAVFAYFKDGQWVMVPDEFKEE
jgi:hypothetical protein